MIPDRAALGNDAQVDARNAEVFVTSSATVTTYAMSVYELVVRIILVSTNAMAVTLPSVAEAKGKLYSICITTVGSATATIVAKGTDCGHLGTITLTDDEDGVILFSDGRNWWVMATNGLTATDYD